MYYYPEMTTVTISVNMIPGYVSLFVHMRVHVCATHCYLQPQLLPEDFLSGFCFGKGPL